MNLQTIPKGRGIIDKMQEDAKKLKSKKCSLCDKDISKLLKEPKVTSSKIVWNYFPTPKKGYRICNECTQKHLVEVRKEKV